MNLKLIDSAIAAYEQDLTDADKQRLAFFRVLWDVQKEHENALGTQVYDIPDDAHLKAAHKDETPIFFKYPITLDTDCLVKTLEDLSNAAVEAKVFEANVTTAFSNVDWKQVVDKTDVEYATKNPDEWFDRIADYLKKQGVEDSIASLFVHFARMALRVQLEPVAAQVYKKMMDCGANKPFTQWCPVCGSWPSMAHVGGSTSSSGRGRVLVCPTCATAWEFERVRCARCGTTNQAHLHFFNVEGDDSHRIATCDECGGYIRTLYSEDQLKPTSYDVEDVVMARLDAIAQDPQLAKGKEQ